MENFAEPPGLIAEQLWDLPSSGELKYSYPSGSAMPLAWAHAEYITLVRSATDGVVFDLIPAVTERYLAPHSRSNLEIWNFYRQIDVIDRSEKFRIILAWPFRLHWSNDGWAHTLSTDACSPSPRTFLRGPAAADATGNPGVYVLLDRITAVATDRLSGECEMKPNAGCIRYREADHAVEEQGCHCHRR